MVNVDVEKEIKRMSSFMVPYTRLYTSVQKEVVYKHPMIKISCILLNIVPLVWVVYMSSICSISALWGKNTNGITVIYF